MTCAMCPTALRPEQKCFCSYRCFRADAPSLRDMLTLMEATRGQWLTLSDISIWLYGDDSEKQRILARTVLLRLRKRGYRFESRPAPWDQQAARAYRLVGSAVWRMAA